MAENQAHRSGTSHDGCRASPDVAFSLLGHRLRRDVLSYLTGTTGPVPLCELADRLARWDGNGVDDPDRVATSLYHVHLPRLAAGGLLAFDETDRVVEAAETTASIAPYLDLAVRDDLRAHATDRASPGGRE